MSLEAIERVDHAETQSKERKAAAELEAKQITAGAEQNGQALLERVRAEAAAQNKRLMHTAEEQAQVKSSENLKQAQTQGEGLRAAAGSHMDAAAEWIVGRIVKN